MVLVFQHCGSWRSKKLGFDSDDIYEGVNEFSKDNGQTTNVKSNSWMQI